jgi:hypothetical protein
MSDWITDRLPTVDDAMADGKVWTMYLGNVVPLAADRIPLGSPWQPIPRPAPYVKPKRWTAHWNKLMSRWNIVGEDGSVVATLRIDVDGISTAQRIADIYNEAMP